MPCLVYRSIASVVVGALICGLSATSFSAGSVNAYSLGPNGRTRAVNKDSMLEDFATPGASGKWLLDILLRNGVIGILALWYCL